MSAKALAYAVFVAFVTLAAFCGFIWLAANSGDVLIPLFVGAALLAGGVSMWRERGDGRGETWFLRVVSALVVVAGADVIWGVFR